jgi:Ca2+-transporting ATPase
MVKGSPEEVLERCTSWMWGGEIHPLEDDQRRRFDLDNEQMAGQALRVLGVAFKEVADDQEDPESELIWLGLTGMADPIREGVQKFIEGFHRAGINTVMITGDQSPTAYAIAKDLKLSRHKQTEILDSSDLSGLDPEKRQALFDKVDVFARVSPGSKLEIVQALQAAGKVVAMTGDGINDMPALKAADVGVAMGSGSSNVVQDVADMIIEDDNLETLINAVSRGRTTYGNIRKSVHFLLSTNMGEIIVTTIATALGLGEPLNTMELLWLNLVTDIFPGLALAMEPPEPSVLDQPPRDPDEPILRQSDFSRIALESGTISLCALAAYSYSLLRYGQGRKASTTLFMSLTIGQILHTWSCRSETNSIFNREQLPRNPYVEGATLATLGLQILPIAIPPLRNLLQLAILDPVDWGVVVSTAMLALVINESTKKGEFPIQKKERKGGREEERKRASRKVGE